MFDVNLSSLGVPIEFQTQVPQGDTMPTAFSPNTEKLWTQAVGMGRSSDPKKAWLQAIENFVTLCEQNATFPFHQLETQNDHIFVRLLAARRCIVKFIDKNKVMAKMRTDKTVRSVTMTADGFVVKADATCKIMTDDPDFLSILGLRKSDLNFGSVWSKELDKDVTFYVANEGARLNQRWHYGYEVCVDIFPSIPGNPTPSSAELEKFVLEIIYMPMLRAFRPRQGHMRLI